MTPKRNTKKILSTIYVCEIFRLFSTIHLMSTFRRSAEKVNRRRPPGHCGRCLLCSIQALYLAWRALKVLFLRWQRIKRFHGVSAWPNSIPYVPTIVRVFCTEGSRGESPDGRKLLYALRWENRRQTANNSMNAESYQQATNKTPLRIELGVWATVTVCCVRWLGGDAEYPLGGLPITLVLCVTHVLPSSDVV